MSSGDTPEYAQLRPALRTRVLFLACTTFFWFSHYCYTPTLAPYTEHRGGSFEVIGLVVSAYGFALLLFRLPLGLLSDSVGKRKLFITLGLIGSVVAGLTLALSPSPEWMIVGRFVSGLSACAWVTFTVLYASYYPSHQTVLAMGHIAFCNGLSIMFATALGGWLADQFGWLAPFWAASGFGLGGTVISLFLKETSVPKLAALNVKTTLRVLRNPTLLWTSIVASLAMYTVFASSFGFLPNYAVTLGASKTQLGLLSTITLLCSSFAGLAAGRAVLPRLGPRLSIALSYGIAGGVVAAIPYTSSLYVLFLIQAVNGLCRGTAYPILMTLVIHDVDESDKATAMGFYQSAYSGGMFLGPVVAGQIGGWMGYEILFTTSAAVSAIAAVAAFKLPQTIRR